MTTRREISRGLIAAAGLAMAPSLVAAEELQPIELPPPRADFGTSLAQALKRRRSTREFASRPLSPLVLSELLWSAYGVNRPITKDRTAPSWRHARETEIFAAMRDGVWRYDPIAHRLVPHLAGDVREQTGVQDFVGSAPLNLVYVSNAEHLSGVSRDEQHRRGLPACSAVRWTRRVSPTRSGWQRRSSSPSPRPLVIRLPNGAASLTP
jgi:hypothetical protein